MFRKLVKISIILVYLVIVAGAVVRMTGSGMGCPDWPKCFGYYIPPTERAQLEWHPEQEFHKGQVIIVDETLQVAKEDFTSTAKFNKNHWKLYTKHDYAKFNPTHTWVEYINRLVGALSGLAVFIMAIASFWRWKKDKKITLFSWASVFLMGFQAWLGATVVYSVLAPVRITLHMVVALLIVALLLYILHLASEKSTSKKYNRFFSKLLVFSIFLTLIQVVLGTEVRQFIDERVKEIGYQKELWLNSPSIQFYIHRSFSILVFLVNVFLWYKNRQKELNFNLMNWILFFIILEIFTGIWMAYFDFPFASQSLHLVLASILFGFQFYIVLQARKAKIQLKKS
ncbi:COX15/CtaA family protein [Mesonia maritima]|uniref:Cytochrome c oxidase assembly protein subunit 15 n=1 Tax=Mesonia maritima TaxID=1793873 RepID=A0ABU1K759_9FLAO|nr:COX15/CtaA family protein [Mesonia maritima]MDR6301434.1 cytochrome c oxidase assembly protein subunit 15 [Mesonia maritima]